MAKYYVRSGCLRLIISKPTREQAAHVAIHRYARSGDGEFLPIHSLQNLGLITAVSEKGFRDRAATCYPTDMILREVGPFGNDVESE